MREGGRSRTEKVDERQGDEEMKENEGQESRSINRKTVKTEDEGGEGWTGKTRKMK